MPTFNSTEFLRQLTHRPGVYRMYDADDHILYVGKAKDLKKRVTSYFRSTGLHPKTRALVSHIARMEITLTHSETEALLLEQNQIKLLKPPYNILLRDDKSYPYIYLSPHKDYPSLTLKRTRYRKKQGEYFGPYPSSYAVKESLNLLQKIFKIRQCEESFFKNRSRPCLQHQINRCTAPCVNLISEEDYLADIASACRFLKGQSPELIQSLIQLMEVASQHLNFEKAALYRDQIQHLRHVQEQQSIEQGSADVDALGMAMQSSVVVIVVLMFRGGRMLGSKTYYPEHCAHLEEPEILEGFLGQYYLQDEGRGTLPKEILLPVEIQAQALLQEAISDHASRKIRLAHHVRGERQKWLGLALTNANNGLKTTLSSKENIKTRLVSFQDAFGLDKLPTRLECFDISHSSGEKTVASCVVFNETGPAKGDYRIFNIEGITGGDDYAAMEQVLTRRLKRLKNGEGKKPDVLLIDGGKGQLGIALTVVEKLAITGIQLIGVAKGVTRKAGFETLILPQGEGEPLKEVTLPSESPALHLIQYVRDESHRFAITGHRKRRDKARRQSTLESLEGVGPKRRRELLRYFGDVGSLMRANTEEMAKVQGISRVLADKIYEQLHEL